jgi:magnesium-transporting ATPase (P-type)
MHWYQLEADEIFRNLDASESGLSDDEARQRLARFALAFEPGEKGVLERPPRNPQEGIMSRVLIQRTILVGLVVAAGVVFNFVSALNEGVSLERGLHDENC